MSLEDKYWYTNMAQRRRRWASMKQTSGQRLVFAGYQYPMSAQQTWDVEPLSYGGPTVFCWLHGHTFYRFLSWESRLTWSELSRLLKRRLRNSNKSDRPMFQCFIILKYSVPCSFVEVRVAACSVGQSVKSVGRCAFVILAKCIIWELRQKSNNHIL